MCWPIIIVYSGVVTAFKMKMIRRSWCNLLVYCSERNVKDLLPKTYHDILFTYCRNLCNAGCEFGSFVTSNKGLNKFSSISWKQVTSLLHLQISNSLGTWIIQRQLSEYTLLLIAHSASLSHSSGDRPQIDNRSSRFWYLDSSRSCNTSYQSNRPNISLL